MYLLSSDLVILLHAYGCFIALPLWLGYCDFMNEMASQLEEENPAGRVRAVFEEALMAGGLHVKLVRSLLSSVVLLFAIYELGI